MKYNEVPIYCNYKVDGHTKQPVSHGLVVIISILKYMEVEHSLLFFGIPGLILFILGALVGFSVYLSFIQTGFIPFGPSLITIALLIISILLGMTGLILHAVINANRRM